MGGADDEVVNALYGYGRMIGTAFQIQDEYLKLNVNFRIKIVLTIFLLQFGNPTGTYLKAC